ncbi:class D sortase [Candidatus Saccharibacteria bacterium]|nr:class D sortase [Candidatus Saccharibacteria bacterium]
MVDSPKDEESDPQFGPALPLPEEVNIERASDLPPDQRAAADIIRHRVEAAYQKQPIVEPEFIAEAKAEAEPAEPLSKHQQFIFELAASGRPRHDIKAAWHEYYIGLSDEEKHQVWREFNEVHAQASKLLPITGRTQPPATQARTGRKVRSLTKAERVLAKHSRRLAGQAAARIPQRHRRPLKSLAFGVSIGAVVILITLFTFFNERFIAPFIQPSRNINTAQIITASAPVSTKPEIIIPKINVQIPVVYFVKSTEEAAVQQGLENGVVHYGDTAQPGENGNSVIVGHSASNIFNRGRYKFAFSLLNRLTTGDLFYLQKNGVRYTYRVYQTKVVKPTQVSVLAPQAKPAVATLITCDPPGANSNRLVVVGEQISPDPGRNRAASGQNKIATTTTESLPGPAPSLWSRIVNWFTD